MKASTQKKLGLGLVVISILVGVALYFANIPLLTVNYKSTNTGNSTSTTRSVNFGANAHPALFVLSASTALGLVLIALARNERRKR